tara:strand:- start:469 stop:1185 length:717 start_codon:yes stop_codon:yes gene_type:complete
LKAIILAAGRGSRMKSLTKDKPKCLIKVQGKTLLERQIQSFHKSGINEIAIVTGYKNQMLSVYNLIEFYNSNWANTQMVESLASASDWLEHDQCIVSYGDIFYDKSAIQSLMQLKCNVNIALVYDLNWLKLWKSRFGNPLIDAETFRINSNNTLIEIGNKPHLISEVQGQYMGLMRFTPEGWKEFQNVRNLVSQKKANLMDMTETLQLFLLKSSMPIYTVPYDGLWGEVDTESDLKFY